MRYPKAGDLQRETASHLATNPAKQNPWEVRSDSGLEGVFAEEDDANTEANDLRAAGVRNVTVEVRERATRPRPPRYALRNPASDWASADRTVTSMAQNIEAIGVDGCNNLFKYVAVEVEERPHSEWRGDPVYGWLIKCLPGGRDVIVEMARGGGTLAFHAGQVIPVAGRVPESPTLLALRAKRKEETRGRGNPASDRLFVGVYPTGIVYADKARERDGDYLRVAFLPFSTLMLQWSPGNHPAELRDEIMRDAAQIIARRGEPFEVSSSGQTVILGGEPRRRATGAPPLFHTPKGRPPGVPNPGPRVLREKWGDASEIVIESSRHGYTGWLESKRDGGRLPISFGAQKPETAREALELAKKFLRAAHGRSNPAKMAFWPVSRPSEAISWETREDAEMGALVIGWPTSLIEQVKGGRYALKHEYGGLLTRGEYVVMHDEPGEPFGNPAGLTAKGERMYESIKEGYGDDPRSAEIASRTVLARATETPGLKKRRR